MESAFSSIANEHYDVLHFIQTEIKNDFRPKGPGYKWAQKNVQFLLQETRPLIDPDVVRRAKAADLGIINEKEYRKVIDPIVIDVDGAESGGKAEYFYADFVACPVYIHLANIIDTHLKKVESNIIIRAADELSKSKRQKENERIIKRDWVRGIMNDLLSQMGMPAIRAGEDPYAFIERFKKSADRNEKKAKKLFAKSEGVKTMDDTVLNDIVNSIFDDEGLALYQEYIYRTDSEIAVEIGIKYFNAINKWNIIKDKIVMDIRRHGAYAVRFYTSLTTGMPVQEHVDLSSGKFQTLPFSRTDGMDCTGFIHENTVSYSTFLRMFGAKLDKQQLKEIFDQNRGMNGGNANTPTYDLCTESERSNAKIKLGYAEWESQNMEVYREGENNYGNYQFNKKLTNYKPPKNSNYKRTELHLNVWYKCYYIPQSENGNWTVSDDMIFDYGLLQDQQRFGEDGRMSKSSYDIYKDRQRLPMNDIIAIYMKLINLVWLKMQNDVANDQPYGQGIVEEALSSMLSSVDSDQKKGKNAAMETIRMLKQKGIMIFKQMHGNNKVDKPIVPLESGYLKAAAEKIIFISELYNQMTMAIGINDVTEGVDPKPRQALGAIEMANTASNNSRFHLEQASLNCELEQGWRYLYFFHEIVNSNDKDRIEALESIVGETNSKALSGIRDIPLHKLGIYVDNIDTEKLRASILEMAGQEYQKGNLLPQDYLFLLSCENVKQAMAVLRLKLKKREQELKAQREQEFNQAMALEDKKMAIAEQMEKIKGMMKAHNIEVQGIVTKQIKALENRLQTLGALDVKAAIKESKKEEMLLDHELNMQEKTVMQS